MRSVGPVALLLGACVEVPPPSCPEGGDADGDGWACDDELTPDCDDGDPTIHPGAIDDCSTPADEDCFAGPLACQGELSGLQSSTEDDAQAWMIHGGGLTIALERGYQWVISSLRREVDGVELVSRHEDSVEQFIGVTLHPRFDQWQVTSATPTVLDAGPAYVRVQVDWENNLTDEDAEGVSTYGVFPDARIHRHERFTANEPYSGVGMFLVTHWSLDSTRFTRLASLQGDQGIVPSGTVQTLHSHMVGDDAGVLCAYEPDDDRRVTMAWRDSPGAEGSRAMLGEEDASPRLALNYDWYRNASGIAATTYQSVTALAVDDPDETGAACASAATLADELRSPGLDFDEGAPGPSSELETGYVVAEGLYEAKASSGERKVAVTPRAPLLRGLMLRVVVDAPTGVTVWRNGARLGAGIDYLVQPTRVDDVDGVTVFIPGRIDDDDLIEVSAPGGELDES